MTQSKIRPICSCSSTTNDCTFTALHCTSWLHSKGFDNTNSMVKQHVHKRSAHYACKSAHTHRHTATGLRTNYPLSQGGKGVNNAPYGAKGDNKHQVPQGMGGGGWCRVPVGAQMARRLFMAVHRSTMYLVVVVLPQPGPPVTTQTGERAAVRIASLCPSDSCSVCPAQGMTHWVSVHGATLTVAPQPIMALQTCKDSIWPQRPAGPA